MNSASKKFPRHRENPNELLSFLDKNFLRELLEDYAQATGLTANIVSINGTSMLSRKDAQENCEFCKLIRILERKRGINRCADAYRRAGLRAVNRNEPDIFRCPAGLMEWVAPIVYEGIHLGSLVCGQALTQEPDEYFWIELEQKNREITDDIEQLKDAAKRLQVVSPSKVRAASRMLEIIASFITESALDAAKQQNDLIYQKSLLEKERITRRELERKLNTSSSTYLYDQMRGLLKVLQTGDFNEAHRVFAVILTDIITGAGSFTAAYTATFDLISSVSRYAIEAGIDPNECMKINMKFCAAGRLATRLEDLVGLAGSAFEEQIALIRTNEKPRKRAVDAMRGYVKSHLNIRFALADVAAVVNLSPYYASRIFKEDQGMTIMQYARKLRMNEACYLLANPNWRICEIAAQLGYEDQGYFARAFKKEHGMSPHQYRLSH